MFIFVLIAILLLVMFWQYILAGLGLWVLVVVMRTLINWTIADPKPHYRREPIQTRYVITTVQARPNPKPVQARPEPKAKIKPAHELPALEYLPRWTANRRLDAVREHAQWQQTFDNSAH